MALTETQLEHIGTSVEALGLNAEPLRPLRLRSLSHEHVRVSNFGVVRMPITLPTDQHWTEWADFQARAYGTLGRAGLSPKYACQSLACPPTIAPIVSASTSNIFLWEQSSHVR